ncbi:1,5-anhydro-D-fructose reductase [Lepus europaeus]|uniref:1,5-anhydro-D-fructose reductase n=1 Tax=Lepus europaeus TaxID=9983 RepID=UPI002B469F89|nr:1,5-anhydro-D-fructose reductase [Lepus europaeus]
MTKIPVVGLGTWKAGPGEVTEAVKLAIDLGYKHFDCASLYHNESEVGTAVYSKIVEDIVTREDLFIVSKLWCTCHKKSLVKAACIKTLKTLNLEYIDLYLMHWPMGFKPGKKELPLDHHGSVIPSDTDYLETWEAMEELVKAGLVKAIGVCNFNHEQLERLLRKPGLRIKPVTNQIECHPYLTQKNLIGFCQERDVSVTAYYPFGSSWKGVDLMDDPVVQRIAQNHGKTPAQILLRFQIQRNVTVIPIALNPQHINENIQVFDFELKEEDMDDILGLDKNLRWVTFPTTENHKDYPFHAEY